MKVLLTMLTGLLLPVLLLAQRNITGQVVNKSTGEPLTGATIKTGSTTALSGNDGNFSISAKDGDVISFFHVGFVSRDIKVASSLTTIKIEMEIVSDPLETVVITGYSTEKKKDLKGAVSVVKVGDALKETNANLLASLQGRVAGVNITTDGAPGSGTVVNIRGISSILGDIQPLYIIDGVPTKDINGLSPNDIESLQVMKDAASAVIYGARGANGVIVISTKTGKSSKVKITFDAFYGVKNLRGNINMLNAREYGEVLWQQKKK